MFDFWPRQNHWIDALKSFDKIQTYVLGEKEHCMYNRKVRQHRLKHYNLKKLFNYHKNDFILSKMQIVNKKLSIYFVSNLNS